MVCYVISGSSSAEMFAVPAPHTVFSLPIYFLMGKCRAHSLFLFTAVVVVGHYLDLLNFELTWTVSAARDCYCSQWLASSCARLDWSAVDSLPRDPPCLYSVVCGCCWMCHASLVSRFPPWPVLTCLSRDACACVCVYLSVRLSGAEELTGPHPWRPGAGVWGSWGGQEWGAEGECWGRRWEGCLPAGVCRSLWSHAVPFCCSIWIDFHLFISVYYTPAASFSNLINNTLQFCSWIRHS